MKVDGRAFSLGFFAFLPLLAGCPKNNATPDRNDAMSDAAVVVSDGGSEAGGDDDGVEPVYPLETNAPPVPLAEKLCKGLQEMPETKRSTCCKATMGIVVTSECVRNLSAAIRHKALDLAESDVDACLAAFDKTLSGCDWVGPFAPGPPPACMGIMKGKIAAGQKCRSSLECTGTLRCLGVGPTTPGKCGNAKSTGELCGGTVDTLATYTRQNNLDTQHAECKEKCIKHKCAPPAAVDATCQTTQDCEDGLQCLAIIGGDPKKGPAKKCMQKPMPKEGEACPGGVCEGELQCIKNKCSSRRAAGQDCTADFECIGGCLKPDGGDKGKCGMRCDIR
jgi:hypothetical protein